MEPFNEEEVRVLQMNPYTKSVSPSQISFTAQFRQRFCQMARQGLTGSFIFAAHGYNPIMLGNTRITKFYIRFTCRMDELVLQAMRRYNGAPKRTDDSTSSSQDEKATPEKPVVSRS